MTQCFRIVLLSVLLCACGDDGGPIDGTWTLTATRCDAQPGQFPPYTLSIDDTRGTFELQFASDCVATFDETYAYSDRSITISPERISCNPSAGCAGLMVSCTMLPPPVTYDFERAGNTLTFSKTSDGPPLDPCPAGQQVQFVMTGEG